MEAVRGADKTHFITSHAAVPALFTSPTDGFGEPDDWKMAAVADAFGTSLYPKHSESAHPWSYQQLAAEFKLMPLGVIDALNEWADEQLGDFLLDGDDPVKVNASIIPKLP